MWQEGSIGIPVNKTTGKGYITVHSLHYKAVW